MKNNKKPIYKRPWFTPLLITTIIVIIAIIWVLILGRNLQCGCFLGGGKCCNDRFYDLAALFAGIVAIPFIALVWIIFGLFMLWHKIHTKNEGLEKTKKDYIIPVSITQILASSTLIICFAIMEKYEVVTPLITFFEIIPLSALAIILHVNSIRRFYKKIASKKRLSKSEINTNIANYICIALLVIIIISSLLIYERYIASNP